MARSPDKPLIAVDRMRIAASHAHKSVEAWLPDCTVTSSHTLDIENQRIEIRVYASLAQHEKIAHA